MKTRWISSVLLVAIAASMALAHDGKEDRKKLLEPYKGPKKRIAVMYSPPQPGSTDDRPMSEWFRIAKESEGLHTVSDVGNKLTEMLTTALFETGRFMLLERKEIQDVRDEIAIGKELGNEKTAVKSGNVLGAELLVRCSVTEFVDNGSGSGGGISLGGVSVGGSQKTSKVGLDLRFVDASTSRIVAAVKASGDSKQSALAVGLHVGSAAAAFGGSKSDPIERATRAAVENAVVAIIKQMAKIPWEGKIAKVEDDGGVVINRGEEDGLKVGDVLTLCVAGEDITDPDTGEVLERAEDKPVGTIKITWVGKRICKGTVLSDAKAAVKMVVRIPGEEKPKDEDKDGGSKGR